MANRLKHSSLPELALANDVALCAVAFLYLSYSCAETITRSSNDLLPSMILFCNGLLALSGFFFATRNACPLYVVFFLFNFLFLSVAPLQQSYSQTDQIFGDAELVAYASAMCLMFNMMGFACFLRRTPSSTRQTSPKSLLDTSLLNCRPSNLWILLAASAALTCYFIAKYGSALLSNRQTLAETIAGDADKSLTIFVYSFLHPFIFTSSFIGLIVSFRRRFLLLAFLFAIVLCGAALVNNPIVQARFRSSTLIVFALLVIYGWHSVRTITYVILGGIAASPIYNSLFRLDHAGVDQREFLTFFAHMDFDALNIFCYTIRWTADRGLEYGSNIFGAILFFIPRFIWEEKGKHVGGLIFSYLKEYKGYATDNLSSPPPVEGYLSFGLFGAAAASLAAVLLFDFVERKGSTAQRLSFWHLVLCLSPILLLIFLRGPLQVGISEWALQTCTILACTGILLWGSKRSATTSSHTRVRQPPSNSIPSL